MARHPPSRAWRGDGRGARVLQGAPAPHTPHSLSPLALVLWVCSVLTQTVFPPANLVDSSRAPNEGLRTVTLWAERDVLTQSHQPGAARSKAPSQGLDPAAQLCTDDRCSVAGPATRLHTPPRARPCPGRLRRVPIKQRGPSEVRPGRRSRIRVRVSQPRAARAPAWCLHR